MLFNYLQNVKFLFYLFKIRMGIKRIGDFYNLLMRIVFVRNEIYCQQALAALINTRDYLT
ncbi:hypothetical protein R1N_28840 [Enterobacter asburiae]|nr:hypothetical protein EAA2563_27610 [Enterobacter asburiae]BCP70697.1 hypothetical protein R1N_28840 [Enterobacter asburiae]